MSLIKYATNTVKDVWVMIEFVRIGEIDTMNEKYQAEVRIEARWIENQQINEYDRKKHWNPELYIENILQEQKEQTKYDVSRDSRNDSVIITEIRNVKGSFIKNYYHMIISK